MAQHARSVLRAAQWLSKLSECASTSSTPPLAQHPAQLTSLLGWSRGFALNYLKPSNPDEQYTVISPSGGGGSVLRTPVFAIFELGGRQYKVSPGDYIYAERLKGVDVGAQLALSKVQAAGSAMETLVGRPYVEGASVTAVIEEQVQDAKVITFKKRRRKNSRRTKGHRQLLTGLRITGVDGIRAPENEAGQIVIAR